MKNTSNPPFTGAWAALVTAFNSQNRVNLDVMQRLVEFLVQKGVSGIYLCGTTGQGLTLSVAERKLIASEITNQLKGRIPVMIHVGAISMIDASDLASHAASIGASGISSIIPPLYTHPAAIYRYFEAVSQAAPELPLLTYVFTGTVDAVPFMRSLMGLPNLKGLKYTGPNMSEFSNILQINPGGWSCLSGMDEQCVYAAMAGSHGNIGSTLNLYPAIYNSIHHAVGQGRLAEAHELQMKVNRVTETLLNMGWMGTLWGALRLLGFDCGNPRPPYLPMPSEKSDELRKRLEESGFWDMVNWKA